MFHRVMGRLPAHFKNQAKVSQDIINADDSVYS